MNKQFSIFLVLLLLVSKAYSQHSNKISFEGGALINKPLIDEERQQSDGGSTTWYDWTFKYHTSTGYYLKFSHEGVLFSKRRWTLLFPIGVSYLNQVTKYERHGAMSGCFASEDANETKIVDRRSSNLSFGPSLQYETGKIRTSGNFILNNTFTFDSKTRSIPYNADDEYYNAHHRLSYNLYVSSQLCVLYNIKNKLWIGPACEIFYGNVLYLRNEIRTRNNPELFHDYGPNINITGKNIWINPGIKLQIDLK